MRLHALFTAAVLLSAASLSAHADTVSVFNVGNQSGAGNIGTVSIDTTTGKLTNLDISLSLGGVQSAFNVAPTSQVFSPYLNVVEAVFQDNGNNFLLELPTLSLVNYSPANLASCATVASTCDYLANAYVGAISSQDLAATFEGNLVPVGGGTGVTPEPSSIALLGSGLMAAAAGLRRRRQA